MTLMDQRTKAARRIEFVWAAMPAQERRLRARGGGLPKWIENEILEHAPTFSGYLISRLTREWESWPRSKRYTAAKHDIAPYWVLGVILKHLMCEVDTGGAEVKRPWGSHARATHVVQMKSKIVHICDRCAKHKRFERYKIKAVA